LVPRLDEAGRDGPSAAGAGCRGTKRRDPCFLSLRTHLAGYLQEVAGRSGYASPLLVRRSTMWQKPEFEIVEVTMEVTAYVARR
jgi:coenzyme PQQ precursor peptide PqqA